MVSLVVNEYPTTVKTKKTISIDTTTIEEVMDVEDDKGTSKTDAWQRGTASEELLEGPPPGIVGVPEWDVEGWWGVAGVGTDGGSGDVEETGLEEVSGRYVHNMVIVPLKRDDSQDVRGHGKEVVLWDKV
jgi:hypothetical protein